MRSFHQPKFLACLGILAAALLAGCGSAPVRPGVEAPGAPAAPPVPSARDALDNERVRLGELFKGTPVVFVTTSEGNMRATVPRRYCFDSGATVVRPPLAAVLGRIAKGQLGTGSRLRVAVPTDPNTHNAALAQARAASVRDWLAGQGIAADRLQVTAATQAEQVEVFVIPVPPA